MSRGQRIAFLAVAVVIAVVAIVVLADTSEDPSGTPSAGTATPTATSTPAQGATATPTPSPTATSTPAPPLLTGDKVTKIEVKQGDTVRFRVRSPVAEEVHVHTYDIMKELAPNKTVSVSFKATITGIFDIEFEHAGQQIAELRVDPK
jgi:FtsP/CotA-like multicopper oxidase with cupredoxin domain